MNKPFQRIGSISNAQAGRDFELAVQKFLLSENLDLQRDIKVEVGIRGKPKEHSFDLGCLKKGVIVECKSHKWTAGGNVPSAKLTVWNEAMYLFLAAPKELRKLMFVLRDFNEGKGKTLAEYYIKTYSHLIPEGVEFWEYDETTQRAERLMI